MSWHTNKLVLGARNVGRNMGFNRWLALFFWGSAYEEKYDQTFLNKLKKDDCVWDVGANIGYYAKRFMNRVGQGGVVFAFEPSPLNFTRLKDACSDEQNIKLFPFGLGRENGSLCFQQGEDDLGATSRIVDNLAHDQIEVDIRSGKDLVDTGTVTAPNAIKIDVEGFELEVLQGLEEHLLNSALCLIGVEVHFGILKSRGMSQAPYEIEALLQQNGFHIKWVDSSHIVAVR